MRIKWKLTAASIKMFFREKEAVFWTIFLPLFMVILFGLVRFDPQRIALGFVNQAGAKSEELRKSLKSVTALVVTEGPRDIEIKALQKGERDLVLIVPPDWNLQQKLPIYTNNAKPQEAQLGTLLVQQALDRMIFEKTHEVRRVELQPQAIKSRKLTYMDFLVPGILAMSIMQMGIFSVGFVFVDLKKRGILRRLRVTPINPNDFIFAQIITRLLVLMMQIVVLTAVGIFFFHLNFTGNLFNMFVIGILGAIVFLGIGFAIAGVSKSEDQVAPLANVVSLPMMLLSGIFFSRANLPGFAHAVTAFFPLTYLADGMRSIAIDGASLPQVAPQLIGLVVWCGISTILAVRLFRWE
jgi:ABC-2 type transport system permease protein